MTKKTSKPSSGMPAVSKPAVVIVALALVVMVHGLAGAYPRPGRIDVVSDATTVSPFGFGFGSIGRPAITPDGRHVAFWTDVPIDPDDTDHYPDLYVRDRVTGDLTWVSPGPGRTPMGNISFGEPAISHDGRYVAFSVLGPMVPGDSNEQSDAYVRDLETETTELVSIMPDGTQFEFGTTGPSMSADGRYVVFSQAIALGQPTRVWLRDREAGTTRAVTPTAGLPSAQGPVNPSISADGRFVAYQENTGPNAVVPSQVNVVNVETGVVQLASRNDAGIPGTGSSSRPSISADGRFVSFLSAASNLVPRDTNVAPDVFVHDLAEQHTERVSVSSEGTEAATGMFTRDPCLGPGTSIDVYTSPGSSFFASISGDGRYVAFVSISGNLVPGDTNECYDVFVHDRLTRSTERVSTMGDGSQAVRAGWSTPAITPGGEEVAFEHFSDLVPGDTNLRNDHYVHVRGPDVGVGDLAVSRVEDRLNVSGWAGLSGATASITADPAGDATAGGEVLGVDLGAARLVYRPERGDLVARISPTSLPPAGGAAVYGLEFSVDGRRYEARVTEAGARLFRCDPACAPVADLGGSVGTTGTEALVVVPLSALAAEAGDTLSAIRAFAGPGSLESGALQRLDEATLPDGTIPTATVSIGVAPSGTPEEEVAFETAATLQDGRFVATLDPLDGAHDVWARACLGERCGARSVGAGA
jgi:Tol biopolymer transport system component